MKFNAFKLALLTTAFLSFAAQGQEKYVLKADRVFDGEAMHTGWVVIVEDNKISWAGPAAESSVTGKVNTLAFAGCTIVPGLIEGHSHLLLHPYNETPWDDQVLKESDALRISRATVHARKTLEAGFTTVRDLGTEGAGYADVGLKHAIDLGIIPGPRMLVAGRAIVATGSYGPKGFDTDFDVMLGAEAADGDDLIRVVRDQIGKGADLIKVYADYRWGQNDSPQPTFSQEEFKLIVSTTKSSGRPVVAHAVTPEGMRRAIVAGVETIEHGDNGTDEIFKLMKEHGVALCPTLAAGDATSQYRGWKKGSEPEPEKIKLKRLSFKRALNNGVTICAGGDIGVFPHGDNVRELEMMVDYGMKTMEVLKSVTSVNARVFHLDDKVGFIKPGLFADLVVVNGDPSTAISDLRKIKWVMKNGEVAFQK
ncbi:MAG: amidohydrolase family protein [Chryseolinea sp.]